MPIDGVGNKNLQLASLRWHYPNQVSGIISAFKWHPVLLCLQIYANTIDYGHYIFVCKLMPLWSSFRVAGKTVCVYEK